MEQRSHIYGVMAEFDTPEKLIHATERARAEGYRRMDAYTPFPVEGLSEAMGLKRNMVPLITLIGGLFGGLSAFFFQWWANVLSYPEDIGGRPLNSWPAFIPITFELTVLVAALTAVVSMLVLNRLPQPHHPVFNAPEFRRATIDRFFLCIKARDPKFDQEKTWKFLEGLGACKVIEVEE